jgi:hypothetical protein
VAADRSTAVAWWLQHREGRSGRTKRVRDPVFRNAQQLRALPGSGLAFCRELVRFQT